MASIVEREAVLDEERPLIAGVYQNRLNPKKWPTGLLQSDPTIFYVNDTLKLRKQELADWKKYVVLGALPKGYQLPTPLPAWSSPDTTPTRAPGSRPARSARPRSLHRRRARRPTRRRGTCSSSQGRRHGTERVRQDPGASTRRTSRSTRRSSVADRLPLPADFAAPPDAAARARWLEADREHRPVRLARLRERMAERGRGRVLRRRPEHMRWLHGLRPCRGRGEGRRPFGPVPRRGGARRRSSPTPATRSRPAREAHGRRRGRDRLRPAGRLATTPGAQARRTAGRRRGRRSSRTPCGTGCRRRRRTWSWSRSTAGSRRCGRSRPPTRSSASRPPAQSPTVRWRRCCPRSAPA